MRRIFLPLSLLSLTLFLRVAGAVTCITLPAECWPGLECYQPIAVAWIQPMAQGEFQPFPATTQWYSFGFPPVYMFYFEYDEVLSSGLVGWCVFTLDCGSGMDPDIAQVYTPPPYTWIYTQGLCDDFGGPPCDWYFSEPWPSCVACQTAFVPRLTVAAEPNHLLRLTWTRHPDPGLFRLEFAANPSGPWTSQAVTPDTSLSVNAGGGGGFFRVTQLFE